MKGQQGTLLFLVKGATGGQPAKDNLILGRVLSNYTLILDEGAARDTFVLGKGCYRGTTCKGQFDLR